MVLYEGLVGKPENRDYPNGINALKNSIKLSLKILNSKGKKK